MINNHKAHGEWKIQLVMKINFISSLDDNEFRVIYTKSDNVEIMSGTETSDAINGLFKSFFRRYQEELQTKMIGSSFTFERVNSLYYHLHKISLNRGGSYIDSPEWLKYKGVTINPVALNHEETGSNPQRKTKIKPFINTYNWKKFDHVTGKNLNKIIMQLLLIYFLYHTILSK